MDESGAMDELQRGDQLVQDIADGEHGEPSEFVRVLAGDAVAFAGPADLVEINTPKGHRDESGSGTLRPNVAAREESRECLTMGKNIL